MTISVHLIMIANGLCPVASIKDAPDWVIGGLERFTIEAEAEDPTRATEAQLLEILQTSVLDRFKLKFHRERQGIPGFCLVIAKN
jgi:uncharacterized protein (TIGR03435 family)